MIKGLKRIEFVSQGFKDILFSPGTKELVQNTANTIQANANAGAPADSEGFSRMSLPEDMAADGMLASLPRLIMPQQRQSQRTKY